MTKYINPADEHTTPQRPGRLDDADVEGHRFHHFPNDAAGDTEGHGRRTILDDAATGESQARRTILDDAHGDGAGVDDTEGHGRRKL